MKKKKEMRKRRLWSDITGRKDETAEEDKVRVYIAQNDKNKWLSSSRHSNLSISA